MQPHDTLAGGSQNQPIRTMSRVAPTTPISSSADCTSLKSPATGTWLSLLRCGALALLAPRLFDCRLLELDVEINLRVPLEFNWCPKAIGSDVRLALIDLLRAMAGRHDQFDRDRNRRKRAAGQPIGCAAAPEYRSGDAQIAGTMVAKSKACGPHLRHPVGRRCGCGHVGFTKPGVDSGRGRNDTLSAMATLTRRGYGRFRHTTVVG
jgi:hypothetical protein